MTRGRLRQGVLLAPLIVVGAAVLTHRIWLSAMGRFLVRSDGASASDAVVVLGGDPSGERIQLGAELLKSGYAPRALVSGPLGAYGYHECELAIPYAVKLGYPERWFACIKHTADSTVDEALVVAPELRRIGARRALVVTSNFHARRAGAVFRKMAPDLEFRTVGAPSILFDPERWWHSRRMQKTFLLEWTKTIVWWLGI